MAECGSRERKAVYVLFDTVSAELETDISPQGEIALFERFTANDATTVATAMAAKKRNPTCSELILRDFLAK
jgi:hypothetical protein